MKKEKLRILLLKPSHYDDDGYVVQWWRNIIPAQSLPVVNGIILDANERKIFGENIEIETKLIDEITHTVDIKKEAKWLKEAKRFALMLIGVQTNQYPRSIDLAKEFILNGIPAIIGGFHVSGILAVVPDWQEGFLGAKEFGVSLYAGELEVGVDEVLKDIWEDKLKSEYNYLKKEVDFENAPTPVLDVKIVNTTWSNLAGLDLSRGCPFSCSFCCLVNVQGRKMRQRSVENAMKYIKECYKNGITNFIVSDDNFARNQNWELILDELIKLREEEHIYLDFFIQIDTQAVTIPKFVEKCIKAGCHRVFIGVESIRDENLEDMNKLQNKKNSIKEVARIWKKAGAIIYGGYIIGFAKDTITKVREDIEYLKNEVAIDAPEFQILTPVPGSIDHKKLLEAGVKLDKDLNFYDTEHSVSEHPNMTKKELEELYWEVWERFYTPAHVKKILKRSIVAGSKTKDILKSIMAFYATIHFDKAHPLQGGIVKIRNRKNRRPNLPIEPPFKFYIKHIWSTLWVQTRIILYSIKMYIIYLQAQIEVKLYGYEDSAIGEIKKNKG